MSTRRPTTLLAVLVLVSLCCGQNTGRLCWAFEPGIGFGTLFGDVALCTRWGFSLRLNRFYTQVRVVDMEEHELPQNGDGPGHQFIEAGILAGVLLGRNRYARFCGLAGLSFVYGAERSSQPVGWQITSGGYIPIYDARTFRTVGVPFELGVHIVPASSIGCALLAAGSINAENPSLGLAFALHFGKLRRDTEAL